MSRTTAFFLPDIWLQSINYPMDNCESRLIFKLEEMKTFLTDHKFKAICFHHAALARAKKFVSFLLISQRDSCLALLNTTEKRRQRKRKKVGIFPNSNQHHVYSYLVSTIVHTPTQEKKTFMHNFHYVHQSCFVQNFRS